MKDESKDALGGDETSIGTRTRRNRRSTSRGEALNFLTNSNSSPKQKSTRVTREDNANAEQTTPRNTEEGEKRNHFTRSRNPKSSAPRTAKSGRESKSDNTPSEIRSENRSNEKSNISINACATILAELDARAYHQSLMQDANRITQRILQPMSLPWTHKVVPVARNIPCDIDEMIDIVTADDGFHAPFHNGNFGFGQFETGGRRTGDSVLRLANSSENFRAAARRSSDPGVIDFSTVALPSELPSYHPESISMVRPPLPAGADDRLDDDRSRQGATTLRCFEAMQGLKRRKMEKARSCVTSLEVSVKVNSSSSRTSIFTSSPNKRKVDSDTMPIVLDAILPTEVENGRRVSKARAKIESERLGSYDIRHGEPPFPSAKNTGRIPAGRTRLVWTSKGLSDQRVSYTSLITGQPLENSAVKRPRNIQVRVKVDGEISCGPKNTDHSETNAMITSQASLHCDRLLGSLLDGRSQKTRSRYVISPLIECLPDNTGSIHVVCTSPGSIVESSISPILEMAYKESDPRCTVCWRSTAGGSEVKECSGCGLLAHVECCLDPGELRVVSETHDQVRREEWTCSVCCYHDENDSHMHEPKNLPQEVQVVKKSRRKSRTPSKFKDSDFESLKTQKIDNSAVIKKREIKCSVCKLSGGAMSRICVEGDEYWVHETCRIWTDTHMCSSGSRNLRCVICGDNGDKRNFSSRSVVKCAAPGCHISVHPMCALASTLISQSVDEETGDEKPENTAFCDIQKAKKKDEQLCTQYTLTFANVRGVAHSGGKDPGVKCTTTLPIIFCGIHNPARDQSFYGLSPGGKYLDRRQTLTVPSC